MREFDETAEDLRAAFDHLRAAGGEEPRQRRALKAVLNELYRVQEYRCVRDKVNKRAYFAHAESCVLARSPSASCFYAVCLSIT
jgi:hypothetical protein